MRKLFLVFGILALALFIAGCRTAGKAGDVNAPSQELQCASGVCGSVTCPDGFASKTTGAKCGIAPNLKDCYYCVPKAEAVADGHKACSDGSKDELVNQVTFRDNEGNIDRAEYWTASAVCECEPPWEVKRRLDTECTYKGDSGISVTTKCKICGVDAPLPQVSQVQTQSSASLALYDIGQLQAMSGAELTDLGFNERQIDLLTTNSIESFRALDRAMLMEAGFTPEQIEDIRTTGEIAVEQD